MLRIRTDRYSPVMAALQSAIDQTDTRFRDAATRIELERIVKRVNTVDDLLTFEEVKVLLGGRCRGEYHNFLFNTFLDQYFFHFFCSPHRDGITIRLKALREGLYLSVYCREKYWDLVSGEEVDLTLRRYHPNFGRLNPSLLTHDGVYYISAQQAFTMSVSAHPMCTMTVPN